MMDDRQRAGTYDRRLSGINHRMPGEKNGEDTASRRHDRGRPTRENQPPASIFMTFVLLLAPPHLVKRANSPTANHEDLCCRLDRRLRVHTARTDFLLSGCNVFVL
jgi:hypothetical protein